MIDSYDHDLTLSRTKVRIAVLLLFLEMQTVGRAQPRANLDPSPTGLAATAVRSPTAAMA